MLSTVDALCLAQFLLEDMFDLTWKRACVKNVKRGEIKSR